MVVRISAQGEAGMVARPGSLRETATAMETAADAEAEAEASGFFFSRGRGAQAGFDAIFEAWLGEETVLKVGGGGWRGRGRARECCERALELLRMPRMELRVLLFAGWRSSSEVLLFRGE